MRLSASSFVTRVVLCATLAACVPSFVPARAQEGTNPTSDVQPLFSPKKFGFSASNASSKKQETLTVDARIARARTDFDSSSFEETPGAFLILRVKIADGWHIYTDTQGAGGKPTRLVDVEFSDASRRLGKMFLKSDVTLAKDVLGSTLEELFKEAVWIVPIYGEDDAAKTEKLTVSGTVDALACSEGEGGECFPQRVNFEASFDPDADPTPYLDGAESNGKGEEPTSFDAATANESETSQSTPDATATEAKPVEGETFASRNFFILLLTAFFGGFILNFTPCVLPVVGLKILSFFEQSGRNRSSAFILNLWYAFGTLIVFGALAFASVGLSFLFTRALFQIIMSAIVFTMAISLMGVWELQVPAFLGGEKSNELTSKEGPLGAVFKGIITTLLAIPCGAPLLSPALDWASETTKQGHIGLVVLVYLVIGLGMASPFLVAGAFPELLKFFPKPGAWMETFRKAMGYFLLIAVVWILYSAPLEYQLPTVAFLFALWFACWNIGRNQYEFEAGKKKAIGWAISIAVVVLVAIFSYNFRGNPIQTTLQSAVEGKMTRWAIRAQRDGRLEQEHWALFDRTTLDNELAKGRPVAVDFTADWCMNCKVLEKTILHTEEIESLFDAKNVLTLTADWTNLDAETPDVVAINELLDAHGARQVPTLMIFTPEAPEKPIVLRGLYTKGALVEALETLPTAR